MSEEFDKTETKLFYDKTERGFGVVTFADRYGQVCSLQDSSLASEPAIWFGVTNMGPHLTGPSGARCEEVNVRMHLTQAMVKQLLPMLQKFADTGDYLDPKDVKV